MRKGVVIGLVAAASAVAVTGVVLAAVKSCNDGLMVPDEDEYEEEDEEDFFDDEVDKESEG